MTALALAVVIVPGARAYSNVIQWQVGFSGTFNSVPAGGGVFGFWGWCVFGGSSGSTAVGTTGNTGDCEFANYFGLGTGASVNTFTADVTLTGWILESSSRFGIPGVSPYFFYTSGTAVLVGPGAAFVYTLLGLPVGSTIPISSTTGPSACGPAPQFALGSPCDTGIPAVPGHIGFSFPGGSLQIQVARVT